MSAPRPGSPRALLACLVTVACLWPIPARAYRPFDSTDAAVADKGEIELELGPVGFFRLGPERALVAPSLILNWGIADGWEAVLEGRNTVQVGSNATEPHVRLEDTALNLKGVLREGSLQGRGGVSVASEVGVLLPTINGEPGAGGQATLILSQRWEPVTIHLNGRLAWTRAHALGRFGGLIAEGPHAWSLRPVVEVFLEREDGGPITRSGLVGAIWRIREGLSLDAGLRVARVGADGLFEVRAGLTWAFAVGASR